MMAGEHRVMLLLGGNVGDVESSIARSIEFLECYVGDVVQRSSMMRSEAWGFECATREFTNLAIELATSLRPDELLAATQRVEREVGRDRECELREREQSGERYASRVIDIDIILYDEEEVATAELTLPHPLMGEREFVLRPIVEIAPTWRHATSGRSCEEMLNDLEKSVICDD